MRAAAGSNAKRAVAALTAARQMHLKADERVLAVLAA
jgi:hypothetical protein